MITPYCDMPSETQETEEKPNKAKKAKKTMKKPSTLEMATPCMRSMKETHCGESDCPICNMIDQSKTPISLINLKTGNPIEIKREDYDNMTEIARIFVEESEKLGVFEKNEGFSWFTFPLTATGETVTFSIRKTVKDGKPTYEWMIEK